MNDVDVKLLEKSFKRYYLSHISEIPIPTEITKREFGYKKFTGGMVIFNEKACCKHKSPTREFAEFSDFVLFLGSQLRKSFMHGGCSPL